MEGWRTGESGINEENSWTLCKGLLVASSNVTCLEFIVLLYTPELMQEPEFNGFGLVNHRLNKK